MKTQECALTSKAQKVISLPLQNLLWITMETTPVSEWESVETFCLEAVEEDGAALQKITHQGQSNTISIVNPVSAEVCIVKDSTQIIMMLAEEYEEPVPTVYCSHCDEPIPEEEAFEMGSEFLCSCCLESETSTCCSCGERIWAEDRVSDDRIDLCRDCYEDAYCRCSRCNHLVHNNDAYYLEDDEDETVPYCHSCYLQESRESSIHPYSYKPTPIFYGNGNRFFGVELEIDGAGTKSEYAAEILEAANAVREHIYIKTDSSLDKGLEIVTHPMSAAYHMEEMPWGAIVETALRLGYQSHKTSTCGLHIHISREAFGQSQAEQEQKIAHLLYLVEKFWGELLRFSRRTESQLKRWAARYGMKEHPADILDSAKYGSQGRYVCVNLLNTNTVEIRIFRGTLKLNTIYATMQMVNRLCDVAVSFSEEELANFSWAELMEYVREPELVQYLKERRLYLNEPVSAEEDE